MNEFMRHSRTARIYAFTLCVLVTPVIATGQVPVAWDASFNPGTIGPGSVSTLQFDISNLTSVAVRNLGFSNTLPAGVTIASPAASLNTCGGTLSATNGGSTISLTDGGIGALGSCSVSVDVTASAPGTYTNVTGDLTSDAGNSGSASADLTVAADRPGFSKSFSPSVVAFGGRTTLTLTVDNTLNTSPAPNLRFTDNLPDGLGIADPSIASTTCTGGNLSAPAGGTVISYAPNYFGDASVAAGAICSVTVEVIAMSTGVLGNTTGELTSDNGSGARSSGKAANTLTVPSNDLSLTKSFTNDPAYPGGTVTLEFTVRNLNRRSAAADIGFTDDLNGTLSGLTAIDTPLSSPCGPGSTLTGNSVLTLASGNLDPEASCTFEVLLQVPAAASGAFTNTTSEITANVDGEPVTGNPATDVLVVTPAPLLTKTYLDDPVGAGGTVELEFSITNTSTILAASSIFFEDVFPVELGTAASVPATGFCGAGAQATFLPVSDFAPAKLTVSSASLAASDSCTFSITLNVAVDAAEGIYPNTTSFITAVVGNETTTGPPASDELTIVSAPRLQKEFTDDPVAAGDTVTLVFTLSHSEIAPGDASGITFSDDLDAALSGLEATGLPLQDLCGQGSQLVGTSTVTFSSGVLAPGEGCSFAVTLQVPVGAAPGNHTNTTSAVIASVLGVDTMSSPASADLQVAGLTLTQDFTDDPVMPGGTVTVRYTLDNASSTSSAEDIQFLHNLNNVVSGLTATVLPGVDPCGAGSSVTGTNLLIFQGGILAAETSCSFDVTLQVPAAAAPDTYNSVTSTVVA
ncbi:MAG: DUF11 domain-containing protein, partial [bacterium]|nr:DUF11 domain-containing protein [bacterium]